MRFVQPRRILAMAVVAEELVDLMGLAQRSASSTRSARWPVSGDSIWNQIG